MQENIVYKIDHRYNRNHESLQTSSRPSFTRQIEMMLANWHSLKDKQRQCKSTEHYQEIDFDQIMEEDLENQLQELEKQEDEQYKLLEQTLEHQLYQDDVQEVVYDFEKEYKKLLEHVETLKFYGHEESSILYQHKPINYVDKQNVCIE